MKTKHLSCPLISALVLLTPFAFSQEAAPAAASDDGKGWASIVGTVADIEPSSFLLDYGHGMVKVEMQGWQWFKKGRHELRGKEVRVAGRLAGSPETPQIRALGVFIPSLHTYHYTTADSATGVTHTTNIWEKGDLVLTGNIVATQGREFTLDAGGRKVIVDTDDLLYDPLDDVGYQQLKTGDRVTVAGRLDRYFFTTGRLRADTVTSLIEDLGSAE